MLNIRYDTSLSGAIIDERNERPLVIALFALIAAWTIPVLVALVALA